MIDFSKFYMLNKERFDYMTIENGVVKLMSRFDINTGEINEFPKTGMFHNMELKITEQNTYMKGSLHKMYNSYYDLGKQNHNDFNFCQIRDALDILNYGLDIKLNDTKLTNLEFGLNIELPYDPKIFIENCLLMFDFNHHTIHEKFNNNGDYKEFKRSDYSLKIYNKGKQYNCDKYILRIEMKIISKRVIHRLGIYSLNDLSLLYTYQRLFDFLMKLFDKLLIVDMLEIKKALKTEEMNILKSYSNPNYWLNLKQSETTNNYYKKRRKCNEYINSFAMNNTKKMILKLLKSKFHILMECNPISISNAA